MVPFLVQADATIDNVATPSIGVDLGASGAALEPVVGGCLIAYAVLLITGARLGQTHSYRRIFLLGLAGFGVASLLCGLAPNPTMLVIPRGVQGAGAALMYPQALTGIQLNFSGPARAVSSFALALAGGAVAGQILGSAHLSLSGRRQLTEDLLGQRVDPRCPGGRCSALLSRLSEVRLATG